LSILVKFVFVLRGAVMPHFFDMKNAMKAGRVADQAGRVADQGDLSGYLKGSTMRGVESLGAQAEGYGEKLSKGVDMIKGAEMIKGARILSDLFNQLEIIHADKLGNSSEHRSGPSAPAA
jgi:hypothetical protein